MDRSKPETIIKTLNERSIYPRSYVTWAYQLLLIKVPVSTLKNINIWVIQKRVSFLVDVSVDAAKVKSPVNNGVES